MTTGRSSSRNSRAALALILIPVLSAPMAAHRRDEYLQAARVSVGPDRVRIELDLTPGIAVAPGVLADIDLDRSGAISDAEGLSYAHLVIAAIALDVDGLPLILELIDTACPAVSAVLAGEGTMRIRATARLPRLGNGNHQLRFSNGHRPDIGAYLANALVPDSADVRVKAQLRDVDQRTLTVQYRLGENGPQAESGFLTATGGGLVLVLVASWAWRATRRRRTTNDPGNI